MITWNDKKMAVITALEEYGYTKNKAIDTWQKTIEDSPMICVVDLKTQNKLGELMPIFMIDPENLDQPPSNQDINGVIGATRQIIRTAVNVVEDNEPQTEPRDPVKPNTDETKKDNVKPEQKQSNVPALTKQKRTPVAPWAKNKTDAEIDRHINRKKTEKALQGGKFYSADGGSQVPDAKAIQEIANDAGIDSEIIEAIQTNDYVHVKVRSYMGKHYTEAVVHLDFNIEKNLKILEIVSKNPSILEGFDGSTPIIKADATVKVGDKYVNAQMHIVKTILRYMKFSMRAATTTAMSNTYKKLLNQEWREKEEIEMEDDERATVQDSIETDKAMKRQ